MTRERDDPEKRNLLNEPREEKKRRPYSVSKNKSERRSCESSNNSENRKRGGPYKIPSTEHRAEFHNKVRSQSMPYQNEKKDSWWFWTFASQQDCPPQPAKKSEDTCSCVSCAFKKIVSSEYTCIGCLLLLFTVSIIVAFLVVFKNVPSSIDCSCKETSTTTSCPKCKESVSDSERLKRKIEMLNNKKFENGFIGVDEFKKNNGKGYDDVLGQLDVGVSGIDFGPSFRELNGQLSFQNSVNEGDHKLLNDINLSEILASDKNFDSSGKLREFYKKLIQTDAKIKSLKKFSDPDAPYIEEDILKSPERYRRSLKVYHSPKRYRVLRPRRSLFGKRQANETGETKKFGNKTRLKRFDHESEEPTGFIIEKKKVLVQYKPIGKKRIPVKKCQHAPAGTHTHEKQMMHPFYKNTQKLDILLDKFLNKNLPAIISDPFGLDQLFHLEKLNKHCKHPKPHKNIDVMGNDPLEEQIPKPKPKIKNSNEEKAESLKDTPKNLKDTGSFDLLKILGPESTSPYERGFLNHKIDMIGKQKNKIVTPSSSNFEVLLSVSTIMNPDVQRVTKETSEFLNGPLIPLKDRVPNLRRLMQINTEGEKEENLGYEDFEEVLTDENANQYEMDKPEHRKRREYATDPKATYFKLFSPSQGVFNPNWKGAMPLYPDEINAMISDKQIRLPKPTNEVQKLVDGRKKVRDLSDVEYVEDYLASKYNYLVEQAQAYSDYGVLDGKKESRNDKESPTVQTVPNPKIKLLADENVFKADVLERPKRASPIVRGSRGSGEANEKFKLSWNAQGGCRPFTSNKPPEGIRFEFQPTTKARDDTENNIEIMKMVSKHIKIKPRPRLLGVEHAFSPQFLPSLVSTMPSVGLANRTKLREFTNVTTAVFKGLGEKEFNETGYILAMTRGNRRLLSTKFESSSNFRVNKGSTAYGEANSEKKTSDTDKFVEKLHMDKLSDSSLELQNYIEAAKSRNIKIYSTPQTYHHTSIAVEKVNRLAKDHTKFDQTKTKFEFDPMDTSNFEPEALENAITIKKSLVKLGDTAPENFAGKIRMLVKDPEFGQQHFNLMFNVPLVINLKEELMMMNDNVNYPNMDNQFEAFTVSTIDPEVTVTNSYYSEELYQQNRPKREPEVTTTWSDETTNRISKEKDSKVFQKGEPKIGGATTVTTMPVSSSDSKSSVLAASFKGLKSANRNISALNNTAKTNRCTNYSCLAVVDNMTLSDFFSVISNWFKTLEYGKMNKPRQTSGSVLTATILTLNNNNTKESDITSADSAYPMYDKDMIENIGRRSRVLLSIEDGTVNVTDVKLVINDNVTDTPTAVEGNVSNGTASTTQVVTDYISNLTTTNKNTFKKAISTPKQDRKKNFKAIVKRNADDSNLIFWNDIYDDEYGIQTDKMDNYMKGKAQHHLDVVEKQAVKKKNFLKRSGRWVGNKIRKFSRKINPHTDAVASVHSDNTEIKERAPRSIGHNENFRFVDYPEVRDNRVYDRPDEREKEGRDEIEEDYAEVDQKSLFGALSLNMKEICKKAAKAVQETRNVDNLNFNLRKNGVSDDESKQGSIASALMQQLVRLLTDLVDYQVQQKTCAKLTPELQTFLEWLTNNNETENPEQQSVDQNELIFQSPNQEDEEMINEVRHRSAKSREGQLNIDPADRTNYLDTIHSVQDLLEEYDDMTDDEKSKMTAVKSYLERQLAFLNKQLSAYDLFDIFGKHYRKKRNVFTMSQQTTKHRPRRKPRKFFKNFGRKHTRTTAAYNDEVQVTDIMLNKKANENAEIKRNEHLHQEVSKRNLKDVYYHAVAEAKKYSTATRGPIHKKDEISTFRTSTVKVQH